MPKKPSNTLIPGICRVLKQGFYPAYGGGDKCTCAICGEEIPKGDIAIKGLHWVHLNCFESHLKNLSKNFDEVVKHRMVKEI